MSKRKRTRTTQGSSPSNPTKNYFGYNLNRKHYAYVYDSKGDLRKNILISSKPNRTIKRNGKSKTIANVELDKHPNPSYIPKNANDKVFLMTRKYSDHENSISIRRNWNFTQSDIAKVNKIITKK